MSEHSARDSPGGAVFLLGFQKSLLGSIRVDHLVEACENVASGDVLEGLTRLQEQATLRNLDLQFLVVPGPDVKTRES